jgi:hypothetical protein
MESLNNNICFRNWLNELSFRQKLWNGIFEDFSSKPNKVLEWGKILEKFKQIEELEMRVRLKFELAWAVSNYYSGECSIRYWSKEVINISSKEPVHAIRKSCELDSPETYSTIKHKWKFDYKISVNDESYKRLLEERPDLLNYIKLLMRNQ